MEEWEYQVRIRRNDPYLDSSQVIRRSGGFDRAEEEEIKFIQKGEKNNEIKETLYKAVEIKKLGWINCDRFYEIKANNTPITNVISSKRGQVSKG